MNKTITLRTKWKIRFPDTKVYRCKLYNNSTSVTLFRGDTMFSIYSKVLIFHARTAHIKCKCIILVAACLCKPRCVCQVPSWKTRWETHKSLTGCSTFQCWKISDEFPASSASGSLADLASWMALISTLGWQYQRRNTKLSCAYSIPTNSLSQTSSNSHLLYLQTQSCYPIGTAVHALLAWVWQMNDSNEWLGLEGSSEMSGSCIPCACSLHVGLTKAIAYYIQHGHVSDVTSSKNSLGPSLKIAPIIAWHVKVQKFKSWELLLVRWIKNPQKPFAAHCKLQHISQEQWKTVLFSQCCRSQNNPAGKISGKCKEKKPLSF